MKEEDYELLKYVTEDEIAKTMKKKKGDSAPGLDGITIPLYEKGDSTDLMNYRMISLGNGVSFSQKCWEID